MPEVDDWFVSSPVVASSPAPLSAGTPQDVPSLSLANETIPSTRAVSPPTVDRPASLGDLTLIRSWGFEYLSDPGLLICVSCDLLDRLAYWGDTPLNHRKKHPQRHPHPIPTRQFNELVQRLPRYCQRPNEIPARPSNLAPIPHLPIWSNGLQCNHCGYTNTAEVNMRKHLNQSHPGLPTLLRGQQHFKPCQAQRYHTFQNAGQYFAVLPPEGSETTAEPVGAAALPPSSVDLVDAMNTGHDDFACREIARDHHANSFLHAREKTEMDAWDHATGWKKHLDGVKVAAVVEISPATATTYDEAEEFLVEAMAHLQMECEEIAAHSGRLTRRVLVSPNERIILRPFRELEPATRDRYCKEVTRVLVYILRLRRGGKPYDTFGMRLSDEQVELSNRLDKLLRRYEKSPKADPAWRGGMFKRPRPNASTLVRDVSSVVTRLVETLFMPSLHCEEPFGFPLVHWFAVRSIRSDGKITDARAYTPHLAPYLYWARLIVLRAVQFSCERQTPSLDAEGRFLRLRQFHEKFLSDSCFAPASEILHLLAVGKRLAALQFRRGVVHWLREKKEMSVGGRPLPVQKVKSLMETLVSRAERVLLDELVFATAAIFPTPQALRTTHDNFHRRSPHYSFRRDPVNQLERAYLRVVAAIQANPAVKARMIERSNGTWSWSRTAVHSYRRHVVRFLELLLVLVHFSGGQPARGPEILSVLTENTSRVRNIYVYDDQMLVYTEYSKTRAGSNKEKSIIRFLPHRVGRLLYTYLVYVQPFAARLEYSLERGVDLSPLGGDWSASQPFLWHQKLTVPLDCLTSEEAQGYWTTRVMSNIMKALTLPSLGVALNVSTWRHVATELGRVFCGASDASASASGASAGDGVTEEDFDAEGEEDDDDGLFGADEVTALSFMSATILDRQAGRSLQTSLQNYGDIFSIFSQPEVFRIISSRWHSIFPAFASQTNVGGAAGGAVSGAPVVSVAPDAPSSASSPSLFLPYFLTVAAGGPPAAITPTERRPQYLSRTVHQVLRRFYGPTATFDSLVQAQALNLILNQTEAGSRSYIVLGTGAGKSLLYQLPAILNPCDLYVVIAPFRALQMDIQHRCLQLGIPVRRWSKDTSAAVPGVVTVPMESARDRKFQDWVQNGYTDGCVKMIFNDEAQTGALDHYRDPKRGFPNLQYVAVPTVHLTATLPPSVYPQFEVAYGSMEGHRLLRACTQRPNIVYQVRHLANAVTEEDWLKAAAREILRDPSTSGERVLIYVPLVEDCRQLTADLNQIGRHEDGPLAGSYHRYLSNDQKDRAFERWRNGTIPFMVSTSALGVGIDIANIRRLYHVDAGYSLLDFAQQSGRAGRDKKEAMSISLMPSAELRALRQSRRPRASEWCKAADITAYENFLTTTRTCRRAIMSAYLDGQYIDCRALPGAFCDICACQRDLGPMDFWLEHRSEPPPAALASRPVIVSSGLSSAPPLDNEPQREDQVFPHPDRVDVPAFPSSHPAHMAFVEMTAEEDWVWIPSSSSDGPSTSLPDLKEILDGSKEPSASTVQATVQTPVLRRKAAALLDGDDAAPTMSEIFRTTQQDCRLPSIASDSGHGTSRPPSPSFSRSFLCRRPTLGSRSGSPPSSPCALRTSRRQSTNLGVPPSTSSNTVPNRSMSNLSSATATPLQPLAGQSGATSASPMPLTPRPGPSLCPLPVAPPALPEDAQILLALQALRAHCVYCLCTGDLGSAAEHSNYWACDAFQQEMKDRFKSLGFQYRRGVSNHHCWRCHLPDSLGTHRTSFGDDCAYKDVVKEVVYFAWCTPDLRTKMVERFPCLASYEEVDFLRWLARSWNNAHHQHPTHMWLCFLALVPHIRLRECTACLA